MSYLSLSLEELCHVVVVIRLSRHSEGQLLFNLEPLMKYKSTGMSTLRPTFSYPLIVSTDTDAGRPHAAHSINFQSGYDTLGPFVQIYPSFDASHQYNTQSSFLSFLLLVY